jgi:hypothetical protein
MQRFREFIGLVTVKPTEARAPWEIELYGVLGSFVKGSVPFEMVAEEGLEPPTRGL